MRIPLLALLTVTVLPLPAAAEIYRWVDADGVVHYSEAAPPEGNYQRVHPLTSLNGIDNGSAAAGQFLDATGKRDAEAAKARQAATQAKAEGAEKCAKARERIAFLQDNTAHRLMVKGADGQPARMTDDEFDKELKTAQQDQAKYCN
jgi:hypothetical protein